MNTLARGINDSGQIVGSYTDARISQSTDYHGFLLSGGSYTTLDFPGATSTLAYGINDSGQIVGSYDDAGGFPQGFLLSGGNYTTVDFPGATSTVAYGINDSGQIVGSYIDASNFNTDGFLLSGGSYTTFDVPAAAITVPGGINDSGQIVGHAVNSGFLLSGGSYTTLDFPGAKNTIAAGINDSGQIVGYSTASNNTSPGFLLSGGSYTTLDVPGETGTAAAGINDSGQIVGSYLDAGGNSHGFVTNQVEITATTPTFDAAGGVDYGYTISGGDLPRPTTVALYWATGETFDDVLPGTSSFSGTTTETAQGNYGPIVSARQFIPDPPAGATYILAVADPNNVIQQEDGVTNVEALPIPSLSISYLEWNTDLGSTANMGIDANFTHRGIDFEYTIGDADLPIATTLAFYWASAPDPKDIIGPAVPQVTNQPSIWQLDTKQGLHNQALTPQDGYSHINDAARWGTPPPQAMYVLAVADPEDKVIKQASSDADGIRTFDFLSLATEAKILNGSVTVTYSGPDINATFTPGAGPFIPMSEAEVSLGVDHFNWYQEYTDPENWSVVTVPLGLDDAVVDDKGSPPLYDGNEVLTVAAAGDQLYEISDPLGPQPVIDFSQPVDSQPTPKPTVDPIVEPNNGPLVSQGEIYHLPDGNSYLGVINFTSSVPDHYLPLYNDLEPSSGLGLGNYLTSTDLTFHDRPSETQFVDVLNTAKPVMNPYGPSGYASYTTTLVGVSYDLRVLTEYNGNGFNVGFTWKSNTVSSAAGDSGGILEPPSPIKGEPSTDLPPVVSGGVFDVQPTDQFVPIGGISFNQIPDQSDSPGQTIALTATAVDSSEGQTLTYSLAPGAPAGAAIDSGSGAFTWRVPDGTAPGDYPVTIRVTDASSPPLTATTSFNIVVSGSTSAQTTSFSAISGTGTFGSTASLTATLSAGGSPLAGKTVAFSLNEGGTVTPVGMATTDANGVATLTDVSLVGFSAGTFTGAVGAGFAGDATDTSSNGSGDLTISPAQATLSLSGLTFTYDGSPRTASVSTNPAGLGGVTVSYAQNNVTVAAPTQAGSYTVTAALNNPNYTAAPFTGTLMIHQATPTITWAEPADVTSGTPLGNTQLDATASVPGTFSYSPAAGTVLNAGQGQTLAVTFTPTDTANYATASGSTLINVVSAPPPPTPPHATGLVGVSHSKKGLISITIGFNEALERSSAINLDLYSVLGAVTKRRKTLYSKAVGIRSIIYDGNTHVTINLAKPFKGAVQVTVRAGIAATNGTSSSSSFSAVTK